MDLLISAPNNAYTWWYAPYTLRLKMVLINETPASIDGQKTKSASLKAQVQYRVLFTERVLVNSGREKKSTRQSTVLNKYFVCGWQ